MDGEGNVFTGVSAKRGYRLVLLGVLRSGHVPSPVWGETQTGQGYLPSHRTGCAAGGTPLVVTQEDFLVEFFFHSLIVVC